MEFMNGMIQWLIGSLLGESVFLMNLLNERQIAIFLMAPFHHLKNDVHTGIDRWNWT